MAALDAAARSSTPMFDIEGYSEATTNPVGVHPDLWDDPEAFLTTHLDAAVARGFIVVCLRNFAGKPNGPDAVKYGLLGPVDAPAHIRTTLETKLAALLEDRGLTAWWYTGGEWTSLNEDSDNVPPIPDPANESDEIDRFSHSVRECGCEGVFFDGVANSLDLQGNNRTDDLNDLAGYLYGVHGLRTGIEAIPGDNEADYTVKPTDIDPVRGSWFENYVFASYLFSETDDYMEAFRPPFQVPAGVQMRVVLRASDSTNASVVAAGGIANMATVLRGLGWIVHADNSVSLSDGQAIADLHTDPGTEPGEEIPAFVNVRGYRGREWRSVRP